MKIPQALPQFTNERVLIVVSAKERGILYLANDGIIDEVAEVQEHPEARSDREGFFFRSGFGRGYGSGAPLEEDKDDNLRVFVSAIAEELNAAIAAVKPTAVYLFQPQHLKGYLDKALKCPNNVPVHIVRFGNYLNETPLELVTHIRDYHDDSTDPGDPTSVAEGPDADAKRRILSVGKE